jgi:hypothetical protein
MEVDSDEASLRVTSAIDQLQPTGLQARPSFDSENLLPSVAHDDFILYVDQPQPTRLQVHPSFDSKKLFRSVAHDDFILEGDISGLEKYTMHDTCNPCLSIEGIGQIGSPMGETTARAIVSLASPVVFPGSDSSRDVKSHMWQVSADKVSYWYIVLTSLMVIYALTDSLR